MENNTERNMQQPMQQQMQQQMQQPMQRNGLEHMVGNNIMGILASILIFIGLILVATVAYDSLSDVARMVGCFIVSILILGCGLWGMKKNRNAFFISLAGCGTGAVYISFFLTYAVFGIFNEIVLYILLALWSVAVFFLDGKKSVLFKLIGQLGLLISLLFGIIYQNKMDDHMQIEIFLLVLFNFYFLISLFYLFLDRTGKRSSNIIALVINSIGVVIMNLDLMVIFGNSDSDWVKNIVIIEVLIYTLVLLLICRRRVVLGGANPSGANAFHVLAIILILSNYSMTKGMEDIITFLSVDTVIGIIRLLFLSGVWFVCDRKELGQYRRVTLSFCFAMTMINSLYMGDSLKIIGCVIVVVAMLTLAYFTKDKFYYTLSMVAFFLTIVSGIHYIGMYIGLLVLFVTAHILVLLLRPEIYHWRYKAEVVVAFILGATNVLQLCIKEDMDSELAQLLFLLICSIVCVIITFSVFCKEWKDYEKSEKEIKIFAGIVTALFLLINMVFVLVTDNIIIHTIEVVICLGLCIMNIPAMMKHLRNNPLCGYYIGIKLTLFLAIALSSYNAAGFVVSLCCLLMSIGCILVGFIQK
ncbi:MAG TPA: DUF2339 domain-containing protein, partial [Lachnospiraceae bacterium]|nr:DUF2339 domain-containing protein [Lachnospiraceae bacterium]